MTGPGPRFGRVMTAMVTPMRADGSVNTDGAAQLARWLVEQGNDALVVCGTTGESPTLAHDEKLAVFEAVVGAVDVPVIAGTTGPDTAQSVELSREAAALGVQAILSLCPYYNRPSQAGIAAHLAAVAAATDLPNIVYDIPIRTGRKISTAVLIELATEYANVVGVKDAAGNPAETARLIAELSGPRPDFEVYSGDDSLTLPLLAVGASGVIGVATHWSGPDHVELMTHWFAGRVHEARTVNQRLLESYAFETSDEAPNPIPSKAMLRVLGHDVGECRLPLGQAPAGLEERAREVHRRLEESRG